MKRSTAKKMERPAAKEPDTSFDDTAWFDVMRATLSPYWSARLEHTSDRSNPSEDNAQDAA